MILNDVAYSFVHRCVKDTHVTMRSSAIGADARCENAIGMKYSKLPTGFTIFCINFAACLKNSDDHTLVCLLLYDIIFDYMTYGGHLNNFQTKGFRTRAQNSCTYVCNLHV